MTSKEIQICTNCVMDSTDPKISFDENEFAIIVIPFMKSLYRIGLVFKITILSSKI